MRIFNGGIIAAGLLVGVALSHSHGEEAEQLPLHERVWEKDTVEELKRKWEFEVRLVDFFISILGLQSLSAIRLLSLFGISSLRLSPEEWDDYYYPDSKFLNFWDRVEH